MYLVFTGKLGENYPRPFRSLLACSCVVFRVLINSFSFADSIISFLSQTLCLFYFYRLL